MGIIIDTCILIEIERGKVNLDFTNLNTESPLYISSITVAELLIGVNNSTTEERRIKKETFLNQIIASIEVIDFGIEESRIYANILSTLYKKNVTIGIHDLLIAATAISNNCSVLTRNIKDFERIEGVNLVNLTQNAL